MNKLEYLRGVFGSELKPRARLVLQCLIFHANKEGLCFPSLKTIAAECGYGLSTIKRALNELYEAGYVERTARFDDRKNGGQTSNLYALSEIEQPAVDLVSEEPAVEEKSQTTDVPPRDNCAVSYIYSFSEGLKKCSFSHINGKKKQKKQFGLGGSPNLYPLELNT